MWLFSFSWSDSLCPAVWWSSAVHSSCEHSSGGYSFTLFSMIILTKAPQLSLPLGCQRQSAQSWLIQERKGEIAGEWRRPQREECSSDSCSVRCSFRYHLNKKRESHTTSINWKYITSNCMLSFRLSFHAFSPTVPSSSFGCSPCSQVLNNKRNFFYNIWIPARLCAIWTLSQSFRTF